MHIRNKALQTALYTQTNGRTALGAVEKSLYIRKRALFVSERAV